MIFLRLFFYYKTHITLFYINLSMPCSNCSLTGHNVRTCPQLLPHLISPSDDEMPIISLNDSYTHDDVLMGMKELISDPPVVECMVCYEDIEREKVSLKCGHAYCVQCFIKHMRVGNNCAACRAHICDPPKKHGNRTLSTTEISDIIEQNLTNHPDFIRAIHADLLMQTQKYTDHNYNEISAVDRERLSIMFNSAIESTDLTFGFWIAGISMAQGVISAINGGEGE
jgi:hypothetical protein